MIKTIVFDMYGVIIKESKGNFIPFVQEHIPGIDRSTIVKYFDKAGLGEISSIRFLENLGFAGDHDSIIRKYLSEYLTLDTEFFNALDLLKEKFEIHLLSNDVLEWSEMLLEIYNLTSVFDKRIISSAVGLRKPGKEIYNILLNTINKKPNEVLFIDNSVRNLLSAKEIGINTILFNRDNESFDGMIINSFKELTQELINSFD